MKTYVTARLWLLIAAFILSFGLLKPAGLYADDFDLKTDITVNQPFQVPGAELQANTRYILKRLDHGTTDPHILQILTTDNRVLSTFYAASAERLRPTGKTVLTFYETTDGYAPPVHKWFYPGRLIGYDFIYSKAKEAEITAHLIGAEPTVKTAQFEKTEGPEAVAEESTNTTRDETLMAENTGQESQSEKPPDAAVDNSNAAPDTQSTTGDDVMTESTPAQNTEPAPELPRTAGELPLLALAGLASLALRKLV